MCCELISNLFSYLCQIVFLNNLKKMIAQVIILAGLCFGDGIVNNSTSLLTDPTLRFNESCSDLDKDNAKTCEDNCMSQFDDCLDRRLEPKG